MNSTGSVIIDALIHGIVGVTSGYFIKKSLESTDDTDKTREFYLTGGFTFDEAIEAAKELERLEGWKMLGPPKRIENLWGRDLCIECVKEIFPLDDDRTECPECGGEIFSDRHELVSYTVELYRDI